MNIIKSLLTCAALFAFSYSSISFADKARAEIVGEFNQEGKMLFASPLFKSYTRLDSKGKPMKGREFSKVLGTGRGKLRLLPGHYAISAMCSGTLSSTIGKAKITLESGKSYKMVCSRKGGKQALLIKSIKQFLINKWAPKN